MSGQHTRSAALVATVVVLVVGVAVYRQRSTPPASAARPNADLPRLLDLGSDKCQPCKEMAPILAELKREYAGKATVDFLDVWKDAAAAEPYGIRVIPTQIFYDRDGKEVWRHEGFLAKDEIIAKLKELGAK
ncbi:MAG: thioredoxin family protein [Phycisphaerae bacterium]|jgi:thioredoxin 1